MTMAAATSKCDMMVVWTWHTVTCHAFVSPWDVRMTSVPRDLGAFFTTQQAHSSVRWLPMNSIRSREGGLAGGGIGNDGMLSQRDTYGSCHSCGFVGVRGGGSWHSERTAVWSRDGRGRGGVIFLRGGCASEEVGERTCVGCL